MKQKIITRITESIDRETAYLDALKNIFPILKTFNNKKATKRITTAINKQYPEYGAYIEDSYSYKKLHFKFGKEWRYIFLDLDNDGKVFIFNDELISKTEEYIQILKESRNEEKIDKMIEDCKEFEEQRKKFNRNNGIGWYITVEEMGMKSSYH